MTCLRSPRHAHTPRGFTLVEALVVVSIMTLLIALLLPSLGKARETTRVAICQSHLRQYVNANESYANDANDRYVYIRTADGETPSGTGYEAWMSNQMYVSMLGCATGYVNGGPGYSDFLQCPDLTRVPDRGFRGSYGMTWTWIQPAWNMSLMVVRSRVRHPSSAAEITDGTDWHIMQHYANYIAYWDIYGEDRLWSVAYRHRDGSGGNVAHFDGSAEYLTKQQAWDDTATRDALWILYDDR